MKAMILAAGYGKRLRPLTDQMPKPLLPIRGKSMIEYHLEKLSLAGFSEIVINLGHLGNKIPEALGDGKRWNLSIEYSDEGPEPLETGGGITKALPLLGDQPFLLVNGDVWCEIDFRDISKSLPPNDLALLYLVKQPKWRTRGDFDLQAGRVTESENPSLLYSGIAIYNPSILQGATVEKFSIVPRLRKAITRNQVSGILYDGEWDDVGTPDRLEALQQRFGS